MPAPPAAVDLLTALNTVLSRWGRWHVFGAQAVVAYGVPRLSADVDVTLDLRPDEPERFTEDMKAAGPKDLEDAAALWRAHVRGLGAERPSDNN